MATFKEIMAEYGYEAQTTFWDDFTIADKFGTAAIKHTYSRAFKAWRGSHIYLTELVMVLNHKMWRFYNNGDYGRYRTYLDLYEKAAQWAENNLKGKELEYYYKTTD